MLRLPSAVWISVGTNSTVRAGLIYELQNVASGFREWQAKLRFGR